MLDYDDGSHSKRTRRGKNMFETVWMRMWAIKGNNSHRNSNINPSERVPKQFCAVLLYERRRYEHMIIVNVCSHKKFKLITAHPSHASPYCYLLIIFWTAAIILRTIRSTAPFFETAFNMTVHLRYGGCWAAFGRQQIPTLDWHCSDEDKLCLIFCGMKIQRIHINFMFRLATKCIGTYEHAIQTTHFLIMLEV